MSKDHKEQRYVRQLNVIATQLERFKRGFLPFSSPENIKNLLRNIETFLNRPVA
jgi:hypothetical protein